MISCIYSVKDELSGVFHNPVFIGNSPTVEDEAKRLFRSQINNTILWKDNPQDFTLYQIGSMDDESGIITSEHTEIINGKAIAGKE